jgi:hypothetical protein
MLSMMLACGAPASGDPASFVAALREAGTGSAAGLAGCAALDSPVRGECVLAYVDGAPVTDLGGHVCDVLAPGMWRDECHFGRAERLLGAADEDGAVAACREAGRYTRDCARHLWKIRAAGAERDLPAFLSRLQTEFPEHADSLDPNIAVTRDMLLQDALRGTERLSLAACPDRELDCVRVVQRLLSKRWEREARSDSLVRERLCSAGGAEALPDTSPPLPRRLLWDRSPELDGAVRSARDATCWSDSTSAPTDPMHERLR